MGRKASNSKSREGVGNEGVLKAKRSRDAIPKGRVGGNRQTFGTASSGDWGIPSSRFFQRS